MPTSPLRTLLFILRNCSIEMKLSNKTCLTSWPSLIIPPDKRKTLFLSRNKKLLRLSRKSPSLVGFMLFYFLTYPSHYLVRLVTLAMNGRCANPLSRAADMEMLLRTFSFYLFFPLSMQKTLIESIGWNAFRWERVGIERDIFTSKFILDTIWVKRNDVGWQEHLILLVRNG